ncbi:hypothetical protein FNJ62_19735 [Streptomyces benahoarensis]|nr:hypothetical protein FNJ62_19735 [Streptomyces benahoarensis]
MEQVGVAFHDQGDLHPLDQVLTAHRRPGQTGAQQAGQLFLRQRAAGQMRGGRVRRPVRLHQRLQHPARKRTVAPPCFGELPPPLGDRVLAAARLGQLQIRQERHAVADRGRPEADMLRQRRPLHRSHAGVELGEPHEDVDLPIGIRPVGGRRPPGRRRTRPPPTRLTRRRRLRDPVRAGM